MSILTTITGVILLGAALMLVGVLSSALARRLGVPLLLVFLAIGMAAGEDGPGGLIFSDFQATYAVGSVALALILFDGGLRTPITAFRGTLAPAGTLATVGVLMTAAITGLVAWLTLPLGPVEALLIGAVVASTDAAAVFFLLRTRGVKLPRRVGAVLEIEAGVNDPAAVVLTLVLIAIIQAGRQSPLDLALDIALQVVVGGGAGVAAGWLLARTLNRLDLAQGLHPLLVAASAVATYAAATLAGGSGFLAVYLAGLIVGNRPIRARSQIVEFHDALTWLAQIAMFVLLGLLVTPHKLLDQGIGAVAVALALMLVARPVAVFLCLWPFGFTWRERAFVSWVGLRGAVGIFLASIPVLASMPGGQIYFNVAFAVVLVSLLIQGWTIAPAARALGLALPLDPAPRARVELDLPGQLDLEMVGYRVDPGSPALTRTLPPWTRLVLVVRGDAVLEAGEAGGLRPGDHAYFLAPPWRAPDLDRLLAPNPGAAPEVVGEFILPGHATLGVLGEMYGIATPVDETDRTLSDLFAQRLRHAPEVGDRLMLGDAMLIVRAVEAGAATRVAMRLTPDPEDRPELADKVERAAARLKAALRRKRR
ncbi:MAG: potassium/proton antiporter [Alphaproteobacteria bacterium]|nr:MAG: potassium/proton antiporter [Alphaproteobacteria bacterium]